MVYLSHPRARLGNEQQPDIFNRRLLELTFSVIRRARPSLALSIQNILAEDHMHSAIPIDQSKASTTSQETTLPPGRSQDLFMIKLDAATIGQIVGTLTELGQEQFDQPGKQNRKQREPLLTLIHRWSLLGEWLVQQNTPSHKIGR